MRCPLTRLCALVVIALTIPAAPAAAGSPEGAMLSAINAKRTALGLPAVERSRAIERSSQSYASVMLRRSRWGHARTDRVRGVGRVAEILGRMTGHPRIGAVVQAWLASPVHRRVLLSGRYRKVGIAARTGRMGGRNTTVWVVRFAR